MPFCVSGDWAMREPESLDLVARALRKSRIWSRVQGQVWGGTQWCLKGVLLA